MFKRHDASPTYAVGQANAQRPTLNVAPTRKTPNAPAKRLTLETTPKRQTLGTTPKRQTLGTTEKRQTLGTTPKRPRSTLQPQSANTRDNSVGPRWGGASPLPATHIRRAPPHVTHTHEACQPYHLNQQPQLKTHSSKLTPSPSPSLELGSKRKIRSRPQHHAQYRAHTQPTAPIYIACHSELNTPAMYRP